MIIHPETQVLFTFLYPCNSIISNCYKKQRHDRQKTEKQEFRFKGGENGKNGEIGVPCSRHFECQAGNYILLFSVLPSTLFLCVCKIQVYLVFYVSSDYFLFQRLCEHLGQSQKCFWMKLSCFFQYTPWELIHLEITPQCLLYNPVPCLTSALMRKETHLSHIYSFH